MTITKFFEDEYIQYANNDNYQSLSSYIDGFKPTARKAYYTYQKFILGKKSKIKVAQLGNRTAEETLYLGGENNIHGVIVTISQNFITANNIPVFIPEGHFGSRFYPKSDSAPRYIHVKNNPEFDKYFDKIDNNLLYKQIVEDTEIEPRFFIPVLPMALVNGSIGIGNGFAQKILPRKIEKIKEVMIKYLETEELPKHIVPYFKGYKGKFKLVDNKWINTGILKELSTKRGYQYWQLTEPTIGTTLPNILKKINFLEDEGKIVSFDDKSNEDNFDITLKTKNLSFEDITKMLGDIYSKSITENFTFINENNEISVFENEIDVIKQYTKLRKDFYRKKKQYMIKDIEKTIKFKKDRILFIKGILTKQLIIEKQKKNTIIENAKKLNILFPEKHIQIPLYSLTIEDIKKSAEDIRKLIEELKRLKTLSENDLWLQDLK